MSEFVTIGETCAVFAARYIGRMRYCSEYEIRPGGSESTVAVGVFRLGHSAAWVSRVGDDELGHYVLSFVRSEGVDVSAVTVSAERPTGLFVRERLPRGKARHFYYRERSAFSTLGPHDLPRELISGARLLHLTGITPALSESNRLMVEEAIALARRNSVTVTFDPNMRRRLWTGPRARSVLEPLMAAADYVLPGLEDMQGLYGGNMNEAQAVRTLKEIGCSRIILKLGPRGALVVTGDKQTLVEARPIADPVDLMGAGDAFAAGFIHGVLQGNDETQAAALGNAVAAISIETPGNIESLPTAEEVEDRNAGRARIER